jgi:putative phage-type endonuclease
MITHDVQQGTPEWFDVRRGVFTASIASKLLTPTGKLSASRFDEEARLVAERLGLQEPAAPFSTEWMERGIGMEDEARDWFQFVTGNAVDVVGFVTNPAVPWIGCSPDALTNTIEPVELKCPKPSTHLRWLIADELPKEHIQQVHFQMVVCGAGKGRFHDPRIRGWFMSYCPPLRPLMIEVPWNDYTEAMAEATETLGAEMNTLHDKAKGAIE